MMTIVKYVPSDKEFPWHAREIGEVVWSHGKTPEEAGDLARDGFASIPELADPLGQFQTAQASSSTFLQLPTLRQDRWLP